MKCIEHIGHHDKNCERMAARHALTFHCDGYFITEHDDEREARPATEPELAMWHALTGCFDPECLPATPREAQDSLEFRKGPFTLNAADVVALKQLKEFRPCLDRESLLRGLVGWLSRPSCKYPPDSPWFYPAEAEIYISRAIQVGYFYHGERIPELHWRPTPGGPRQLEPELPMEIECKVGMALEPFMTIPNWS